MKIYSGLGNNFIITMYNELFTNANFIINICNDYNVDGIIMVKLNPLEMVIYNKDSSIANMCGNGIRCFINYCYDHNLLTSDENIVKTRSGNIYTKIINTDPFNVLVNMNEPNYIYTDNLEYTNYSVNVLDHTYQISLIECGVWHGIIIPSNFDEAINDAHIIREQQLFKDYLNIDLIRIENNKIYVKTLERGVGYTKACGTGVISSFLILKKLGIISDNSANIYTDGGILEAGVNNNTPYILGPSIKTEDIYLENIDELFKKYS